MQGHSSSICFTPHPSDLDSELARPSTMNDLGIVKRLLIESIQRTQNSGLSLVVGLSFAVFKPHVHALANLSKSRHGFLSNGNLLKNARCPRIPLHSAVDAVGFGNTVTGWGFTSNREIARSWGCSLTYLKLGIYALRKMCLID